MLIDAHCHIMPDRLALAIRKFFEALHERLLFGSDCPNTARTIAESAAEIRGLGLGDRALRAILGENARRLAPPTPR